jgi:heptosyltransferase III
MRILFVTATRIGDAVLSTGLLSHLIDRYPEARFTIAAGPVALPLFEAVPRVEQLIPVVKRRYGRHWLELFLKLAPARWDLVVDLRGSALAWLLRTRERRISRKGPSGLHRVRHLARLFDLDPPPAPRLWLEPEHEERARQILPPGSPVLAIGPAANWRGKQWRGERFAELAGRLTGARGILPEARVAVLAAEHEREQAEPLLAAIPPERRIDLVGRLDLLTAGAVLRRAALFIGNDTGLTHLAAAAGTPTVALFGPSPASDYAPWGDRTAVVQTAIPRHALFGPGFDHRTTDTLMDSLSIEAAEQAACDLWTRIAGKAA